MTTYFFQGGNEYIRIYVKNRNSIFIATSVSSYKLVDKTKEFYDNEEERKECLKMSGKQFQEYLEKQFKKLEKIGYKLRKVIS